MNLKDYMKYEIILAEMVMAHVVEMDELAYSMLTEEEGCKNE